MNTVYTIFVEVQAISLAAIASHVMIDCLTETECLWGRWWMPVVHEDQISATLHCSCTCKYCIQIL